MRRTIAFVFTLLFGFFNPGAQADTPAANTAAAAAQKQTIPQRGTLYRVTYRGNTSYLFGTVHVGKTASVSYTHLTLPTIYSV